VINCQNRILTKVEYIPLLSACEGLQLHKGKIYDIFFSYLTSKDLVALGYIDNKLKETTVQLTQNMQVQTPSGFELVSKLNFGDKIVIYDHTLKREHVRTLSSKRTIKKSKLYCALPISTESHYIINGILIKNAGLS